MRRVAVGLLLVSLVVAALLLLNHEDPGRRRSTAREGSAPGTGARDPSDARSQSGAKAAATSAATKKPTRAKVLGVVSTWDEHTGEERLLPGARVRVFRGPLGLPNDDELVTHNPLELHASATTDAKGEFSFDLAPEPEWAFRADAEGFAPVWESIQGAGEHDLGLQLVRAPVRAVRVVDQEDRPVAGAEVFVYHEAALPMSRHVSADDGSVALPLPEDDAALFVRAPGYALSYIEDVQDMLEEQHGRIVLKPAFALRGLVTDEAGVPLAGVRASIRERTHPPRTTTEDGRFSFEALELKEYSIRLELQGYAFAGSASAWPDEREHTFALYSLVPLSGVVLFPDGTPAPGVSVRAIHPVTTTDEDGRFHFAQVTPRGLPLIAWRDQYLGYGDNAGSFYRYWGRAHFKVERGREPEDVTIQLKERGLSYMRARVFDVNGAPLAKVSVNVTSTHGMGYSSTYTDTEGRVTVACPVFPGAEVLVNVPWSKQDRRTALRTRVRTAATHREDEVALRLPPPIMFTVIARGAAGEPLPAGTHAGIQLWMGNHWVEHSAHDRVTFACEAGLAGPYGLKITAPGYLEFSKWPWKPPEPGGTAEIRLRPAGSITGTLRHASGDAVEDVGIVAVPQEGRRRIYGELRKDGNFIIRGVDAGTYSLWVVHRHQATERIGAAEVAPGGVSDVGILRATATRPLKIVVTDHAGSRVTGARVSLFTGPGKLEEQSEVAVTGRDGTARIEVVPGAEAAVLIVKRGHGSVAFRVDSETHKAITLPQPGEVRCVAQITERKGPRSYSFALRHPRVGITWQPDSRARHIENGMEWTFADVAPGEVEALFHAGGETHVRKVTVVAGQTVAVGFRWPP